MSRKAPLQLLLLILSIAVLLTAAVWVERQQLPLPDAAATPAPTPHELTASPWIDRVLITELMEKNKTTLPDEDGDFSDWFELYNASDAPAELDGWWVSDDVNKSGWRFPACTLAPGERKIVFASKKNRAGGELHTNFGLAADERLSLYDAEGRFVCDAPCGGCEGDISMALDERGEWVSCEIPTPGFVNNRAGFERYQETREPDGPLQLNEAMSANFGAFAVTIDTRCDWVELKNRSTKPLRLSDYYLSDREDERLLFRLPNEELPAGETLIILCQGKPGERQAGYLCAGFSLNSTRDELYLSRADGTLVDRMSLRGIPYNGSYGRMEGRKGFFYFDEPTPKKENREGFRFIAASPVSDTPDGVYEGVKNVPVLLHAEGEIRYTLDGSLPSEKSALYTGALKLEETCVVRAVCLEEGCLPSPALTLAFFINEGHRLPVVSLVTDEPRQFDYMYDSGNRMIELPGALNFFRGDERFSIGCGVRMNGETSLSENKKNLSLRFRGAYGSETLEYDLYGGGVTRFTNLLLRAGQDQDQAIIRNELAQALCDRAGCRVINQRSLYCALYVNGQYAGLYSLKEKANEQLYADRMGVSRDSIILYEAPAPYKSDFYNEIIAPCLTGELLTEAGYARFCERMDIDCLIDWLFIEGFCSNTDVTSGNVRFARSTEGDGRWRILFYDLDAAFRSTNSMYYNLMTEYSANRIQISGPVRELMANPAFRDRFLARAEQLLREELTNDVVLEEIDRLTEEIRPEVARDRARITLDTATWERSVRNLKALIVESDWRQSCIDAICDVFELEDAERAYYFGSIDHKS